MKPREHLRPRAIAARYGIRLGTLASWRSRRLGPPFIRVGKTILYSHREFEAWLAAHRVVPNHGPHPDPEERVP
jgi:hypothetical protein